MRRIALLGIFIAITAYAKDYMVGFGDSITAATMANTSVFTGPPESVDISWLYENKNTLSWFSGSKIVSHHQLLEKFLGVPIEALNLAVPGARVHDLVTQLKYFPRGERILFIELLIGANDVCHGTDILEFATWIDIVLTGISKLVGREIVPVLIIGIPPIPNLGLPEIVNTYSAGFKCGWLYYVWGTCSNMINWHNEKERQEKLAHIREFNSVLKEITNRHYQGLDLAYSDAFASAVINPHLLSVDCFHPSKIGQAELSLRLWMDQPFFH